jgi:hypothetical protein
MDSSPFGFTYEHEGKRYAFDVAFSIEDAKKRLASMSRGECIGKLCSEKDTTEFCASAESASTSV